MLRQNRKAYRAPRDEGMPKARHLRAVAPVRSVRVEPEDPRYFSAHRAVEDALRSANRPFRKEEVSQSAAVDWVLAFLFLAVSAALITSC